MEFYAGLFVVVQFMLVLAAGGLFLLSQQHTRIRRASRESHRLLAIFLAAFAFLIALPTAFVSHAADSFDFSLALFLAVVTAVLCGLVIRRSYTSGRTPKSRSRY